MYDRLKNYNRLWFQLAFWIFASILATDIFLVILSFVLYKIGIIGANPFRYLIPLFSLLLGSLFVGGISAMFVSKMFLKPIRRLGNGFEELAKGNFDVRVPTELKNDDMREISEHFNNMAYELGHVETLRSDFVANVSHEFKTPISAIEGYAALLQNPKLSPEKHDVYVDKILTNTGRLSKLTSNILMLSKLENQETELNKKDYSLDEQLRKAVLLLEDKWTAKNVDFDIELPKVIYCGDENLLDQVWFNLIENAVKHSPEGDTVTVTVTEENEYVTVTIKDNGEGMDEETQKHIFEKFYQGDSSHKTDGNGLGLALVKIIVDICHGKTTVQSEPGKGTAFSVMLPK